MKHRRFIPSVDPLERRSLACADGSDAPPDPPGDIADPPVDNPTEDPFLDAPPDPGTDGDPAFVDTLPDLTPQGPEPPDAIDGKLPFVPLPPAPIGPEGPA